MISYDQDLKFEIENRMAKAKYLDQIDKETLDGTSIEFDKQFLVFSSAGKPIYSYHGNEEALSSLMATAEALMSVTTDTRNEALRYTR